MRTEWTIVKNAMTQVDDEKIDRILFESHFSLVGTVQALRHQISESQLSLYEPHVIEKSK